MASRAHTQDGVGDPRLIMGEINIDYKRTMNKIIFDMNLLSSTDPTLKAMVKLPRRAAAKPTPANGVLQIPVRLRGITTTTTTTTRARARTHDSHPCSPLPARSRTTSRSSSRASRSTPS